MLGFPIGVARRQRRLAGQHARANDMPFEMPVRIEQASAVMAAFPISADRAADLLPGRELHPFRVWGDTGLLVVTAVDYAATSFGAYVEQGWMIVCTHGVQPAPALLPLLRPRHYGLGAYVVDLPVSTERSVQGGKGIWGLPKHRAQLDVRIEGGVVRSRYDKDGRRVCRVEVDRPQHTPVNVPFHVEILAYSLFRGRIVRARLYVKPRVSMALWGGASARLAIGDHPRAQPLDALEVASEPLFTIYAPQVEGVLDDRITSWFVTRDAPPGRTTTGRRR